MVSGKFAITLHILILLSKFPNEYLSSDFLAGSLNLHPVLIRKEIANLKKNGIVESKEGKNGGTKLLVSPNAINMETIFKLTFEKVSFGFSKNEPNPKCPVGKKINENLDDFYNDLNKTLSIKMKNITLKEFEERF